MNFEKPEKSEFWKNKILEISSFYTCVLKATIIWGTVPEIQSETEFFVILDLFLHFYSPHNNPENQNFEKIKASGNDIIFNLCNKKHDYMMYAYSDMECDRHNFLSF